MRCTLSQRGRACRMKDRSSADVSDLISVIVTTYNREDALEAVLSALSRQSDRGFEVVIADDGSGPTTASLVERWHPRLPRRLLHLPRRRLHRSRRLRRDASQARRTRMVRHRKPRAAFADPHRG